MIKHPFFAAPLLLMTLSVVSQAQPLTRRLQAQEATARPTGSFNSYLYSDSAGGKGGSQQHRHTLGLDCFVFPCHGVCQFRPSSTGNGPTEGPINSAENSTDHKDAMPEQSSCPHMDNGHCPECAGHVTNTDLRLTDSIARPDIPMDTDVTPEPDPCPICLVHFHDRDEALVVVKAHCCGHHFDLDCISRCFVDQPIGSRRCAICRQDPMPMVNENTSESHPDKFFPDWTFYLACFEGDLDQVEKSLAEGINVNVVMNNGFTALLLASIQGHKDIAECLINAGANLNARTERGSTSLFIAAQKGHTGIVKLLIEAKSDLNAQNNNGATALFIAVQKNNIDCVKVLVNAGADPDAALLDGTTSLFFAAQQNDSDCVKLLIEAKADLDACTKNDDTPLLIAAAKGNTDCVKLLIEAKADLNARAKSGATALFMAAQEGNTDCVKALTEAGAR
ncbi:ankyrin repeat domain-containing protein [Endozoicomonas sp. ISHI1]|uniref:ankyrin repeat domain-containing protein n=1 Tax=Endozoicomonas sp. ISHI1 TaxID=2825882 RepID=UPI002148DC85|nr:ankyrin repeat domain-containing protein [Endozoicomonas sp. ISHI1]